MTESRTAPEASHTDPGLMTQPPQTEGQVVSRRLGLFSAQRFFSLPFLSVLYSHSPPLLHLSQPERFISECVLDVSASLYLLHISPPRIFSFFCSSYVDSPHPSKSRSNFLLLFFFFPFKGSILHNTPA